MANNGEQHTGGASTPFASRPVFYWLSFDTPRRNPKLPCRPNGIDSLLAPPGPLVAKAMVVPVMGSTEWYGEFVADLEAHPAGLSEPQMVSVSGASPADQTGLRRHELEVGLVTEPTRLADREYAFVDLRGGSVVLN